MHQHDRLIIRDLAKQTREFALSDEMQERRRLWTRHNSLIFSRPLVYIRAIPFDEFFDSASLRCQDPYARQLEKQFLLNNYRMQLAEDTIIEPFLTVRAALASSPRGVYGIPAELGEKPVAGGAAAYRPSIVNEEDVEQIHVADYQVDEAETVRRYDRLASLVSDILPVEVDRQGILCSMWANDLSTLLAQMRGLEQLMWDIYDRPEWLHKLLLTMQTAILGHIDQTEKAGGFRLINHQNQAMPYACELEPPRAGSGPVPASQLWGYMAAQEFTSFGPDMFDTFMFQYQKPILERYGLTAYGCCEDLTQKIGIIRQLSNLRRIAVSPFADRNRCAGLIGRDYVLSWRPDPSRHVSHGLDEDFVRSDLRQAFAGFDTHGCIFDVTLKDVETVGQDPRTLLRWSQLVREEIMRRYG